MSALGGGLNRSTQHFILKRKDGVYGDASRIFSWLGQKRTSANLFNHLVGARENRRRHCQTERPSCLEVDHQFVFCRCLYRQIRGLLALEDAVDIARSL